MSLFAQAAKKKESKSKSAKKMTLWTVEDTVEVNEAIHELVKLNAEKKALEAKMKLKKGVVQRYADSAFIRDFAKNGVMPDAPMRVQNTDGEQVTFVVQDRSGNTNVSEEQLEVLEEVLGADAVGDVVGEEVTVSLSREAMSNEKVAEAVEKALSTVANRLVKQGLLEEPTDLIDLSHVKRVKPGTIQRAALITGNDQGKLRLFLSALGSAVVRYVKV